MENMQNILANYGLYYPGNRQKITVSSKQAFKRAYTSIISHLFSFFSSFNQTIPMISMVFLVFIATSSIIKVTTRYAQQEKMTNQTSLMLTEAIEIIFQNNNIKFDLASQKKAESMLGQLLAKTRFLSESFILLAQPNELVFASSTKNSHYIGKKIGEIIPELSRSRSRSKTVQMSEASLDQQPYHVLSVNLPHNSGSILIINSRVPLLRLWREEVTLEVVFFSIISALLLFILFSYYRQAKKNKENDTILLEANICVETALSRGRCGLWNFNFDNKKFHLSRSMYEIMGIPYENKTLSFRAIARLIHYDNKKICEIARSVTGKHVKQLDQIFHMRHASGADIWIQVRAQMMRTISGGMNIIGIAMDVTEKYHLEKRYAEADQRLSKAIECTSEALVLWDKNDRLVMCNANYQKAYGLPDHVLVPGNARSIIQDAQTRPIIEYRTSDPERSQDMSKEIKLADSRWLQINEWCTHDGGTISVGTDITLLKHNQAQLRESKRRLKATINDLSTSRQILERQKTELSIANAKYQVEKERAETANKTKSEFLAKMSHELRTPLNAILGFSEVIKKEIFGELGSVKYYEYAQDIHYSGQHLLNMINNILEMSKIETEKISIDKQNADLIPIINEGIRLIGSSAQSKNIKIEKKIPSELFFNADKRIIKKILFPILSNSIKFTNNNGKMMIRTSKIGQCVIITIADTGIGIPKSALEKIGQSFEPLHNQYDQSIGGFGLGLAISDALTNLHGGRLKIISQEGKGTIVTICMPQ
ncbi:ATP-binding protein [Candidatus Liberibacter asiaticus]|uniref:sensor histidine kinase n=1 Tax=Liberibacter asiaticus TaxID=34021 RepID=UPI00234B55D7|nr:PAS domain-containing sensor histidine kinase [Candidatus Liberibacter asiaticus]WCM58161.1 ATP-binding protein [Candidatus Liberibacter asiaticus]